MANTTTEHQLKIKADARELKSVRAGVREAFAPQTVREFRRELTDLDRAFKGLTRSQSHLSKQLSLARKGTDEYKKLKDELKGVREQADAVKAAIGGVNQGLESMARTRRQSFMGGLASGTGLSQFMPSGPGQGARMAGAMVGRAGARAARAVSAPFTMPGMQGLSTAIGSIPIVGGAAAGALQTAQGMFQQSVAFDQARQAQVQYRGSALQAGARLSRERALKRAGLSESEATKMLARLPPDHPLVKHLSPVKGDRTSLPGASFGVDFGIMPGQMMGMFGQFMGARGGGRRSLSGGGVVRSGARDTGGYQTLTKVDSRRRALSEFREAMAAQVGYGVNMQQSGAFARAQMAGGGATSGGMGLATTLQGAEAIGLKGSRVREYLSELVNLAQRAEKQGVKINIKDHLGQAGLLRAAGLSGPQSARIAGGLNQKAMGVSARGVSSGADLALLRAAGFDPKGGRESYIDAITKLEGGMNPKILGNLLSMFSSGTAGATDKERAFYFKRFFSRGLNTPVGMGQATELLSKYRQGVPTPELLERYKEIMANANKRGASARLGAGAEALVSSGAGLSKTAASLQAERIGAGRKLASTFSRLERVGIANVHTLGRFRKELETVVGWMSDLTKKVGEFAKAYEGGGVKGVANAYARHWIEKARHGKRK